MTMLTIDISLIRMFSDGPEVSLNGSPTVAEVAFLDVLLGIVPGTSCIGHEHSQREAASQTADEQT